MDRIARKNRNGRVDRRIREAGGSPTTRHIRVATK
jgi:hypothetical protein